MSLVVELLSSKCPPACQTHTPHPQHHIKGHQTPRVKWTMVSGNFIEISCPNKIIHLELYMYTTDQLNPPPTPDPYSPPTTPQPPCKFHNPNVKRFPVHNFSPLYTAAVSDTIGTKWSSDLRPISIGPFTEMPGPVNQLDPNATTLELFSLFWDTSIV